MNATLATAPAGESVVLVASAASADLTRRLRELGLRPGMPFTPLHRTAGGGRVVEVAGSRIALGRELLGQLQVCPA